MLALYDTAHNKLCALGNYSDFYVAKIIGGNGSPIILDTLHFKYPLEDGAPIDYECYIVTDTDEYIVKEINLQTADSGITWVEYVCDLNIEPLKGTLLDSFALGSVTAEDAANLALAGTGWAVGYCDVTKKRTAAKKQCTVYDAVSEIATAYSCEITFDTINKLVNIQEKQGADRGVYFSEQLNLKQLQQQGNSRDYVTRLYPIGKDGLTISAVNGGTTYVSNYQYSTKIISAYWIDNRYTSAQDLYDDAVERLEYLSKPARSYSAAIVDLANVSDEWVLLDFTLGDFITLLSESIGVREQQRIIKIDRYPDEPERSTVELANRISSLDDIILRVSDATATVENATDTTGAVQGSSVSVTNSDGTFSTLNVAVANIGTLVATKADITDLDAVNANISNLQANKVDTTYLTAKYITADSISSVYATIGNLNTTNAKIDNLQVGTAQIQDASITTAKIASATISTANIATGAITTALIGTGAVNTAQIADGSITDAKIVTLTANKISAGTIDASKITVTNLNCANLTVGTINGTQIASGAITSTNLASAVNTSISDAQTTANNSASAAAAAQTTANAAQTSANGKNTVYRQATQPSGGTYTAGDVWFDTGNGNRAYVYSGSAWTLSQFGYQAISSIDAGTITTGSLSAARIAAGTITADKLVIGDFTNMCTNPHFYSVSIPWTCSRTADPQVNSTTAPTAYVGVTSGRDNYEATFQVTPGDQYYCSLTGIPSSANYPLTIGLYFKDKSGAGLTWASCGSSIPTTATTWTTISGTITVPANAVTATVWVQISNSSTISGTWYFTNVIVNHIAGATLIGSGAITTAKIAANAVTAGCIAANCITASQIAVGTITATQIASGTITSTQISAATITGDRLVANAITAAQIAAATITATQIAANTITAAKIAAGTITTTEIAANTITAGDIAAGTITATQIAAATITGDKIAAGTITATNIDVTNLSVYKVQAQSDSTAYLTMTSAGMSLYRGAALSLTITADSGSNYASIIPKGTYDGLWLGTDVGSNTSANGLWITDSGVFFTTGSYGQLTLGYTSNWITFTDPGGTDYYLGGGSGQRWNTVPIVSSTGVMEVGQFIDFHESTTDTSDYNSRLYSSSGTITTTGNFNCKGQITCSSTYPQVIGDGTTLQIANSSASTAGIVIQGGTCRPAKDNQLNLGASGQRWATVYAVTSTINTSDRNEKNTIVSLDADKATSFISVLNPVSYKYNSGTSDRTHYGMISQDVEDEMTALGMTSTDFAGFIKSPKTDEDGNDVSVESGYIYGLRYEEFIAPLIKTVQNLLKRCDALEKK